MNKRNTVQRELVLSAVRKHGKHPTADEIYSSVSADYPSISKGTVYRNLNILAEEKKIVKVEIPGEAEHFDHTCRKHYHIKCIKCGKVFDVDMDEVINPADKVRDKHGFEFVDYEILFKGICPECRE